MLGLVGVLGVTVRLGQGGGLFLVVDVTDPLQEQEREDVGLEVRCVYRPAKDVGDTLATIDGLVTVSAVVTDDYGILVGGVRYESPDIAAEAVSEGRVADGWTFWLVQDGDHSSQTLRALLSK